MNELEEIFQRVIDSFPLEQKRIPVEISKKKSTLAKDTQDYQKAVAENDKYLMRVYQDILRSDEYDLRTYEEKSSFLRRPIKEDFIYRWQQRDKFSKEVAIYADKNEMLCFHGTDILGAKHILASGQISSGADRLGHHTSFDPRGRISVTDKDTVDTSVGQYMNMIGNFLYPAGCLFVVKPKDKAEYDNLSSRGWIIENVDFKSNPDRLIAIVTTPENQARVKEWAHENGVETDKVMKFESFIQRCKEHSRETSKGRTHAIGKSQEQSYS